MSMAWLTAMPTVGWIMLDCSSSCPHSEMGKQRAKQPSKPKAVPTPKAVVKAKQVDEGAVDEGAMDEESDGDVDYDEA